MSETVLSQSIRDTSTYTASSDSGAEAGTILFHVVNGLDAEVTVTFYGTRQEDAGSFNDKEQLGQLTISANGSGFETLSDPWEEAQVGVVATSSPTSGTIDIYEMV